MFIRRNAALGYLSRTLFHVKRIYEVSYRNRRIGLTLTTVGCVFLMIVGPILLHTEFGPHDHREDAFHFTRKHLYKS